MTELNLSFFSMILILHSYGCVLKMGIVTSNAEFWLKLHLDEQVCRLRPGEGTISGSILSIWSDKLSCIIQRRCMISTIGTVVGGFGDGILARMANNTICLTKSPVTAPALDASIQMVPTSGDYGPLGDIEWEQGPRQTGARIDASNIPSS